MSEFNNIIDIIAPRTIKQVRKNCTPYISKTLRQKQQQLRKLHIKAKRTQDNADWTKYKNTKATVNKLVSQHKIKYISNKLDDSNDRWKTIQDLNNKRATTTPRNIINNNKIYKKPQDICNIANDYYINTIQNIRDKIPQIPVQPVELLKNIYPCNKNTFTIQIPTVSDIRNIIINAESSNSTGYNNISMKMLKKTIDMMAPLITHLTTQIILKKNSPRHSRLTESHPHTRKVNSYMK